MAFAFLVNLQDGNILSRKHSIFSLLMLIVIIVLWSLFKPKTSPPSVFDGLSLSYNLNLSQLNQQNIDQSLQPSKNCTPHLCPVFIKIKSQIKVNCDFKSVTCKFEPGGGLDKIDLLPDLVERLSKNWDLFIIYDFNIDADLHKFTQFKLTPFATSSSHPHSFILFSNPEFRKLVFNELSSIMKSGPEKVIVGSELNFIFHQIPAGDLRRKETDAFWSFLFYAKERLKIKNISTSLFFEHMRGTNFWNALNRNELLKLDFISFSSAPLSLKWTEYSKFFPQIYFNVFNSIIMSRYYDELENFTVLKKPIVLTEFRYPIESSDPFLFLNFFNTSNFSTYFSYVPFIINTSPGESSYNRKSTFLSIKKLKSALDSLK